MERETIRNFSERISDTKYMDNLRQVINKVESNEDLVAMSPHIIVVAEKN